MSKKPEICETFPVGTPVRCESEAFPGKWENGTVKDYRVTRHTKEASMVVEMEDGELVDYAPWFVDCVDQRNSLVRKRK